MFEIHTNLITGLALGIEYISPEEAGDDCHHVVIDLVIFRLLINWYQD